MFTLFDIHVLFLEKNQLGTRGTRTSCTRSAAAEAEAEAAAVTAAAGHTRPGSGQRRCACVSPINPLDTAKAQIPVFFSLILEGGQ